MNARLPAILLALATALPAAPAAQAETVNLRSATWNIWGTATPSSGSFGDSIGYDRADSDGDGNPYARWFNSDQGVDYDEAMTAVAFTPPLRVTLAGCFPATRYGYNRIVMGEKNTAFTNATGAYQYPIKPKFGWTTRWDYAGNIHTFVTRGQYEDILKAIAQATATNSQYCGSYGMDWDGQRIIFSFNGTEVDRRTFVYTQPLYLLIRSFELPHNYTTMTVDHAGVTSGTTQGTTTVVLAPAATGVGSLAGTVGGTVSCSGQTLAVNPALGAVSSDLTFTNLNGAIQAVVSGRGSIAGTGVSFTYSAAFDPATGALTGQFRDSDDTTDQAIQFTSTGSLAWRGLAAGTVSGAGRQCSYALTVDLALPAAGIYGGGFPGGTRFNGPLTRSEPITIPVSIPELGISRTYNTNIVMEGGWTAQMTPSATGTPVLNGYMDAVFRIDPPISDTLTANIASPVPGITIPPISIPIAIDMTGRITGNLFGNLATNSVTYRGNWNGNSVNGSQAAGTIEMAIPFGPGGAAPSSVQPRITGSVVVPIAAPASPIPLPQFPTSVTVPLDVRPTVPFVLQ